MATNTEIVQQLYVAYFNRPADVAGLNFWVDALNKGISSSVISAEFAKQKEYSDMFSGKVAEQVIDTVYVNMFGRHAEKGALDFYAPKIRAGIITIDKVVTDILKGAQGTDAEAYANKVAGATLFTQTLDTAGNEASRVAYASGDAKVLDLAKNYIAGITDDASLATATANVEQAVDSLADATNLAFELTNGTDVATSNVFNAGLVYNPAGTDRINALQSEDKLTGKGTNPTLNAVLGNANDNGSTSITPTLSKIETINLDVTGNTNVLDVRFADSLTTLSINKLTAEAGSGITIQNINTPAANLTAKNSANVDNIVQFLYTNGTLSGTTASGHAESGNLTISNIQANPLRVGNAANTEGFETLVLNATDTNLIKSLIATDLENLTINGSGTLSVLNTVQNTDRVLFVAGGLAIGDGLGVRKIDASTFTGTLNFDISPAVGGHADPANSGAKYYTTITGGTGNDTFWTNVALAASSSGKDTIDGGAGANKLVAIDAGVTKTGSSLPSIKNVQTLDLRLQAGAAETAYISAFDSTLTTVNLRNEQRTGAAASVAGTFNLREVSKTIAEAGINLLHASGAGATGAGTPTAVIDTVNIKLKDSTGASDLIVLNVKSDLNTSSSYDYTVGVATEAGTTGNKVENLTINDQDDENNTVTITDNDGDASDLTGTITLNTGSAGKNYVVTSTLVAKTIDASTQASNLTLRVGTADQTIKLGTGNDLLTFDGVDTFTGADALSDAGGTDTMRAAFSGDVSGAPVLAGIEKLQIVATANTTIDMSKVTGLTELAVLSDRAVNANNEIFTAGLAGVDASDVLTLKSTTLSAINFFGDMDGSGADGGDTNTTKDSASYTQTFNGVTLSNNTGDTVAVNISAPLKNVGTGEAADPTGDGIKAYNLGQLTTHGVKTMSINVSNEYSEDGVSVAAGDALTTIGNIYDKDLVTFTATAKGSMNLGTVSGNALGNNITTFDVSAVGGDFTADVVALGNSANVTLAQGNNTFNALGSSGKNVTITSFDGKDIITGTGQDDTINSGNGADTVSGDRGNNVLNLGAGDDVATAKDGNNTVAFGTGTYETATMNLGTGLDATKATNVFTLEGTAALVSLDTAGDGTPDVVQMLAVGAGSTLRVDWTGATLNETGALLDGGKAVTAAGAAFNGTANSDLVIAGAGEATTFTGGNGNDVLIKTDAAAVTFSGGAGNDAFVGNKTVNNLVTGGLGADVIVLASDGTKAADAAAQRVIIADGDSTATTTDKVYGYNTAAAATNALDLVFTNITANGAVDGINTSGIKSHSVTNGVVSFDDADTFAAGIVVGTGATQLSLTAALAYLAANLNNTSGTVGFAYDGNGDGDTLDAVDSFFVFQDGAADTVVQLVGVQAANGADVAAVGTAAAANTVVIV
jgi:hypothetical protein